MIRAVLLLMLLQGPVLRLPSDAVAVGPANLDFETGEAGQAPPEWSLMQEARVAGYSIAVRKTGCRTGSGCAVIAAGNQTERGAAGAMIQQFSADPYQGKTMRLRAWVKLEGGGRGNSIKVAFAADGEKGNAAFVQKGRGVNSAEWTLAEVEGKVPWHAELVHILVSVSGRARAWVDDVSFEAVE